MSARSFPVIIDDIVSDRPITAEDRAKVEAWYKAGQPSSAQPVNFHKEDRIGELMSTPEQRQDQANRVKAIAGRMATSALATIKVVSAQKGIVLTDREAALVSLIQASMVLAVAIEMDRQR